MTPMTRKEEETCKCENVWALYFDMGVVRCQNCSKAVGKERAKRYVEYNTPVGEEPRRLHQLNRLTP